MGPNITGMKNNEYWFSINDVEKLIDGGKIGTTPLPWDKVEDSYRFLKDFADEKVIYGINTGFGPMAQYRVDDRYLTDLQYNIIRSHSTGAGDPLPDDCVKAAMIARLGSFLQGKSGVHRDCVELLVKFIDNDIIPMVPCHGSVGASGDLVQLAHIALAMIGEGKVHYKNEWRDAGEVLSECGLSPLKIHIREGLALTNGTSVMTGIGMVNIIAAKRLINRALLASVWMNEVAGSYDDMMSEALNACRRQRGQQIIASKMRETASGSKCLKKREHELYDSGHKQQSNFEHKVQAFYSLRCTPQILGPIMDTADNCREILENEFNSACDNPIVDPVTRNVYHGGNFHGDYISFEQDKLKIALTKLAMTAERQLNYLVNDKVNGILPPFVNMGTLGLNYGMQACQFTATSTTAECQTLSFPNYVHSIPNNNDNQDIVSMGTNSALICKKVIENSWQVMSVLFLTLAQATDCLGINDKLAPATRAAYDKVRAIIPVRVEDAPFYEEIARIGKMLQSPGW